MTHNAQTIDRLKFQLIEARKKHAEMKMRVRRLQCVVGPTSRELSEAKTLKVRLKDEVFRIERQLKSQGLSDIEISAINLGCESVAA